MTKIRKEENGNYLFYCPGCKHFHAYDNRWEFNGDINNPTFKPSLLNNSYKFNSETKKYDIEIGRCHLYIKNGKIEFQNDCHHEYAGKTIDLIDF